MQSGRPSRTALGAAVHRAAHQVLEHGRIFTDPLAVRILGADADTLIAESATDPARAMLRLFIAVRTRFAEDSLDAAVAAVAKGVRQLVVLGAGLDTYAYRSPLTGTLRIFEVDHPETQAWKRERLSAAGIAVPDILTFAPLDFEHETLAEGLACAGFDPEVPSFFTWLGVVPYLTEEAVFATLAFIAKLPGGAHVVFDYGNPPASISAQEGRAAHEALAAHVASVGEAFKSYYDTDALAAKLRSLGYRDVLDMSPAEIVSRYVTGTGSAPRRAGIHIVRATTR